MRVNDFWSLMGSVMLVALVTSILIRGKASTGVINALAGGFQGILKSSMGSTAGGGYQTEG